MKLFKNKWLVIAGLLVAIVASTAFKLESKKDATVPHRESPAGRHTKRGPGHGHHQCRYHGAGGSQVSGTIQTLYADFNSHVKKDQVVARIDPSLFHGALLQAKADLADGQANLIAAKANLEKAKAASAQAKLDFDRYTSLARDGVVPTSSSILPGPLIKPTMPKLAQPRHK